MARILPSLVVVFDEFDESRVVGYTGRCEDGEVYLDKVVVDGRSLPALIAIGGCGVEKLRRLLGELGVRVEEHVAATAGDRGAAGSVSISDVARKGRGEYDVVTLSEDGSVCVNVYSGRSMVWRCCTSVEDVERVYSVLRENCMATPCKTRDVARMVAEKAGIADRYGGVEGFDWKRFFGDRSVYHKLLYCPLRALSRLGVVAYAGGQARLKKIVDVKSLLEEHAKRRKTTRSNTTT